MVGRAIKARGQVTLTKLYDGTNGTDGKNGSDGAVGAPGEDGKTTYVHVAYSSSADGKTNFSITDPSGRSYIGVLTDFTEKDSTDYTQYSWSLVKGQDGQNGEDGAPGAPGEDGKTTYIHIAYANSADGQTDFSTTENSGKKYIGVLTDEVEKDSTDYTQYSWSLFKGQDGEDGADGTPGKPGADGRTPYVHFAYANSADGNTDFSTTVYANKKFIGTLTDYTVADSTDYTKYTWTLIKGADGADGTPGKPGSDGKTPYIHFAYANSADGKTDFSVTDYSNKKFIGTLTDYVIPDSTDYSKYTWSRLKGESGVGIANTVVEYQITDTQDQPSEDSGWTSSIPNLGTGSYLWTRTTFFYTDGTTSRAYTISKQSDNTYTAVLTNDSITLPSDSNGKVTDFSNSTGNFLVYDGTYQVDSTTIKVQLVQAVNVTVTLGGNAYTITAMDSTKDTGYFDLSYTYKGVALTKRVSVSKSKSGANGTTPIIVNLSANAQVFTFDSNNHANPTSQNILFKTTVSGTTGTPVYKAIPYDESGNEGAEIVMSNSGTNGKMLQVSQLNDYVSILVTASIGSVSDSTTIVRVKDGSSISPIPDPSNTVSSNTPPTDAKDGDWWNDTSQTPNVLKYRYRDKWVQYELDGYYVKANSISGEAIVTNTLEAQKIKYTNSNGTTTNLQTFDFDGMKTVLSDNNGNTYSSMDTAVSSTQSWTSLQKHVNDLGQVNQLFNTEFSPDFACWSSTGSPITGTVDKYITLSGSYSGSNAIYIDNTAETSKYYTRHSQVIPVNGVTSISLSWSVNTVALQNYAHLFVRFIDSTGNSTLNMYSWDSTVGGGWATRTLPNIAIPSGTVQLLIDFEAREGSQMYLSQPMVVFSQTIGDYVPGQYNNNDRVLKIEESADKFQISIGKSVKDAQNSADSANTKVDNISVGGRNYFLNSSGTSLDGWSQTSGWAVVSGTNRGTVFTIKPTATWGGGNYNALSQAGINIPSGTQVTVSFWAKASVNGAKFHSEPSGGYASFNPTLSTSWTRYSYTFKLTTTTIYFMGVDAGTTYYLDDVKIETGNVATDWTLAPEDVQTGINQAVDSIAVGGRNYVINSSGFNAGTSAQPTLIGAISSNARSTLSYGTDGITMTNATGNTDSEWYYQIAQSWQDITKTPLSDGNYMISVDVMGTANQAILRYGQKSSQSSDLFQAFTINNTTWTRISMPIIFAPNTTTFYIRINGGANGAISGTGIFSGTETIKFRNVKIESGNKATDWTTAPEDINNDIENIQSSTNQLLNTNLVVNSEFDNTTGNYTGWHLDNPWGTTVTSQINKHGNRTTADSGPNIYPQGSQMVNHDWSTSVNWIYSDPIPIGAGQPLSGSVTNANPAGSTTAVGLALYVTSYDSNKNKLSGPYSVNLTTVHANWVVNYFENRVTPENTAYVSFTLGWNNGKAYFGQPMLQASSKYTGYIPGTPNSNMAIANAQSTANSAQTSADTANQNLANASKSGIRYIRLRSEGNSDNASTHFSEIKVFNSSGTNVVKGKPALLVNGATNTQSASNATDESYSTYIDLGDMRNSEKYVMFDMGALRYDVNSVQISTYTSTRTYYGVVAQTSSDGISWRTIYRGNITPNQLIGGVPSTVISFGMDTSTVLKLTADNYTLGIDANGNLISGITGNTQQVTLKGNVIHLDGNTVAGPDFFSLWNGKYGSTTIDSTGMEVRTGLSKTKFTNGNMQFITDLGENIGYIGRQVDSVHNNLDYLTFGLNGWHTTYPGDSHYDGGSDFYGGDGILFGISNADGGYAPLLQWNSGLAASYKSSVSGWLFTQPIVGGIDIYGSDAASNKTVSMRFQNVSMSNGFTYPIMTSQQAAGSTGIVIGSGSTYMLGGNSFVWSVAGNGYAYYNTQKRGSSGSSLLMASDGAIIAQTSATKYKSDIEYEPSTSYGDKLLTIDPATWSDKNEKEQIQKYKDTGQEPEYSMNKDGARYYGLIAEDMVKAGLEDLIVRNTENGSVEGIQYEKIGIALIPLLREQRNQINELRVEIERLKEKNNE